MAQSGHTRCRVPNVTEYKTIHKAQFFQCSLLLNKTSKGNSGNILELSEIVVVLSNPYEPFLLN